MWQKINEILISCIFTQMSKNLQQVSQSASHPGKLLNVKYPIRSLFYVDQLHVRIKAILTIFNFW